MKTFEMKQMIHKLSKSDLKRSTSGGDFQVVDNEGAHHGAYESAGVADGGDDCVHGAFEPNSYLPCISDRCGSSRSTAGSEKFLQSLLSPGCLLL